MPEASLNLETHSGRAPTTVWLHHGVGSIRSWDPYLPAAAAGHRAVAYDRFGFGGSPRGRRFTPSMFDEDEHDLRSIVSTQAGGAAHLVGHSDGATIALLLAARAPELVISTTVIAAHVRGDEHTIARLRDMGPPERWPEPLRRSLRRDHGDDCLSVATAWYELWTSLEFAGWSIVDELSAIRCPVLAIHDRRDPLAPPLHAETIAAHVGGATMRWRDSGTHDPHRADRQWFAGTVRAFWRQAEDERRHG